MHSTLLSPIREDIGKIGWHIGRGAAVMINAIIFLLDCPDGRYGMDLEGLL